MYKNNYFDITHACWYIYLCLFTCRFYNSRFDTASRIKADDYPDDINSTDKYNASTTQSRYIQALATALAHYIFTAAYNRTPTSSESEMLTADIMEVRPLFMYLYFAEGLS